MDETEFRRWREAADDARRAAQLQAEHTAHANWACFLAEQSAQLAVKGLLHGFGAGAWGHDLVELGRLVGEAIREQLPEPVTPALQRLSRHYIPARYPDAHPGGAPASHYGEEDARQALQDLATVTDFVDTLWSQALDKQQREGIDGG